MAEQKFSKLSVSLLFDTYEFEKELKHVQQLLRTSGRAMQNVGRDLSLAVSLPLGLAAKAVVDTATTFEYQMARVQAISGSSARSFGMLQRNAEDLGASTIFTATAVGQLQEEFAKLGFTASEITAVTESTLSLAQVTGADLGRAAEIAGSTLRTFGLDVSQVGRVNDIVAVAISRSALDFESFAETMKYAGSQADISGVSIEEISAAMGVLANRGVKGSIAGTRLRMILAKLAEEGGNTHDKFIDLINGSMTMTEAIDRFGVRAASAVPVLQQNRQEFFNLESAMIQSAGSLEAMQKVMDDTSFSAQRRLVSALENLSIQFGKVLLPVVNQMLEVIIAVVNGFAAAPMPIKAIAAAIGGLLIVLPPVVYLMGTFRVRMIDIQRLAPGFAAAVSRMFGPVGIAISLLTAVGAAMFSMSAQQRSVTSLSERFADAQTEAAEAAGKVLNPIRQLVAEYGNENTTLDRKKQILSELQRAQPDYFQSLSTESTTVNDLRESYEKLSKAMLDNARAKAMQGKVTALQQEAQAAIGRQVEAELELEDINQRRAAGEEGFVDETRFMPGKHVGGQFQTFDPTLDRRRELQKIIDNTNTDLAEITRQTQKFVEKAKEYGITYEELFGTGKGTTSTGDMGAEATKQEKAMETLSRSMAVITAEAKAFDQAPIETVPKGISALQRAFRSLVEAGLDGEDVADNLEILRNQIIHLQNEMDRMEASAEKTEAFAKALKSLGKAVEVANGAITRAEEGGGLTEMQLKLQDLRKAYRKLGEEISKGEAAGLDLAVIDEAKNKYAQLAQEIKNLTLEMSFLDAAQDAIVQGSLNIGKAFSEAAAGQKALGRAIIDSASATISALIKQAYVSWAVSAMESQSTPLGKIALLGVGAGALSGFLDQIPKLAQGGIAVGSQLAVVGDNRSGREAIIPLEKLPGLMQKMGGGGNGRLYGTIEGYDIVLSNERNNRFLQRNAR